MSMFTESTASHQIVSMLGQSLCDRLSQTFFIEGMWELEGCLRDLTSSEIVNLFKQVSDECLEDWLLRFKGFFYMTEDILDDRDFYGKRQGDDPPALEEQMHLTKAMEKLMDTAADLLREIRHLMKMETLKSISCKLERAAITSWGLPTLPYKVRELKGRDVEKAKILEALFHKAEGESKKSPTLIWISGPVGIGKTDLARAVYNSAQVEAEFDVRAWIYMGKDDRGNKWITLERSKSASVDQPSKLHSLSGSSIVSIFDFLVKEIEGKKVLIVLDNLMGWHSLIGRPNYRLPKNEAKVGSRMIVTSRFKWGSSISDAATVNVELDGLEEKEYLELFKECAFGDRKCNKYPELENTCEEIAKRFGGNPLAAVMIGHHLKCHPNEDRWRAIYRSNLATIDSTETSILSVLRGSYEQLPWHLKQPYVACALFPKNYPFEKNQLSRIWKAIGFDSRVPGSEFLSLSTVSFFVSSAEKNGKLVLHAILHELADHICDGEFFRLEDEIKEEDDIEIPHKAQHVYVTADNFVKVYQVLQEKTHLRSLVIGGDLSSEEHKTNFMGLLEGVLRNLKGLRLLMISVLPTGKLPDAIGGLRHLRYLELPIDTITKESVRELPTWLSDNQFVGLRKLQNLKELRHAIRKLQTGESSDEIESIEEPIYLSLSPPLISPRQSRLEVELEPIVLTIGESRDPSVSRPLKFSKDDRKVLKEKKKKSKRIIFLKKFLLCTSS